VEEIHAYLADEPQAQVPANPYEALCIFRRLYREDEKAEENWNSITSKKAVERPAVPEGTPTARAQLENEYLVSFVHPGNHYSLEVPTEAPAGADGVPAPTTETHYFEVLKVAHSHSREHVMPTGFSADDISQTAPLALLVQKRSVVPHDATEDTEEGAATEVYADSEPLWVRPPELGAFSAWSGKCWTYDTQLPSSTTGCLVLADKKGHFPSTNCWIRSVRRCPSRIF